MKNKNPFPFVRITNYEPALTTEYAHYLCRETLRAIDNLASAMMRFQCRRNVDVEEKLEASTRTYVAVTEFLKQVATIKNGNKRRLLSEPLTALHTGLGLTMEALRQTYDGN